MSERAVFRTETIEQVVEGMMVFDAVGDEIGRVEAIRMGDPEAITTRGNEPVAADFVQTMVGRLTDRVPEPDVPEPKRSELIRVGYIKVDGPGLADTDRYVRADLIGSVDGERVRLVATRAQLVAEDSGEGA